MVNRLVRTDIAAAGPPESWEDLIGEHEKDLLQWASAHEVLLPPLPLQVRTRAQHYDVRVGGRRGGKDSAPLMLSLILSLRHPARGTDAGFHEVITPLRNL